MSTLVQICVVVVTIAVVLMAYVALRMLLQLQATSRKFEDRLVHLEGILEDSRQASKRVVELMGVLERIAASVGTGVTRIEAVVDRATLVGSTVLDEIEQPVRDAVAVMRGLRSGVRAITERWMNGHRSEVHSRGGENHV